MRSPGPGWHRGPGKTPWSASKSLWQAPGSLVLFSGVGLLVMMGLRSVELVVFVLLAVEVPEGRREEDDGWAVLLEEASVDVARVGRLGSLGSFSSGMEEED